MKSRNWGYWTGGTLVAVGLAALGMAMGYIPADIVRYLSAFTVVLAVLGLVAMVNRNLLLGFALIAWAVWRVLVQMPGFTEQKSGYFWAVTLIAGGVLCIIGRCSCRRFHVWHSHGKDNSFIGYHDGQPVTDSSNDGFIRINTSYSGVRRELVGVELKGGEINSRFGGVTLDLRRAILPAGQTCINVNLRFSGIEMYVPSTWDVRFETTCFIGGYEDKRPKHLSQDDEHVLIVRGNLMSSGITVKS